MKGIRKVKREITVRRLLKEAPGKEERHDPESGTDFWAGKTVCWQICRCPPAIKDECPANKYTSFPCWEIEGTFCKLQINGPVATGTDTGICEVCRVYKKYSGGKRIELKLLGKGIDKAMNSTQSKKG